MKKSLFVMLVLLLGYSGFSQPVKRNTLNVDSLLASLGNAPRSRSSVALYIEQIREIFKADVPSNRDDFKRLIETAIAKARVLNDKDGLAWANYYLGKFYISGLSGYSKALPPLLESLSIFEELKNNYGASQCYMQLGLISYMTQYYDDAIKNFNLSLSFDQNPTSTYLMAISYTELNQYQESKKHFYSALDAFKKANRPSSINECYMYLGQMYVKEGLLDSASYFLHLALKNQASLQNTYSRPYALISQYYLVKGDLDSAEYYALSSMEISKYKDDFLSPMISSEVLSKLYNQKHEFEKAYKYLKLYYSLKNDEFQGGTRQKIAEMQTIFEFKKQIQEEKLRHDEEIREKNQTKNIFLTTALFILLIAVGLWSRLMYVRKSKAELQKEKNISESLLLNILPEEIAQELKEKGKADARDFDMVSILFTDFKGFTEQSAKLSATDLVHEINHCFEAFDGIMEKYGIEKIKTIGDSYMAAGGLPVPTDDSVKNTVLAALEMQAFISARKAQNDAAGNPAFEMRVGIHTGPVVAGIVGLKKFQYDIWGDTVNTANRIETNGEVGKVNISQATYELLKNDSNFRFESRGKILAKGKGEMEMWFVSFANS
jgi:class 3 adenylate cyclase